MAEPSSSAACLSEATINTTLRAIVANGFIKTVMILLLVLPTSDNSHMVLAFSLTVPTRKSSDNTEYYYRRRRFAGVAGAGRNNDHATATATTTRAKKSKQDDDDEEAQENSNEGDNKIGKSKKVENNIFNMSQLIPVNALANQFLDTVEDAVIHLRRLPYEYGWSWLKNGGDDDDRRSSSTHRPTVVILGSGWAAHALLKVADTSKLRIVVVSPSNHFVFTPMLASAAVGTVEYRSMTEAVRAANPLIEGYMEGHAIDVDVERQTVRIQLEPLLQDVRSGDPPVVEIRYDTLVVAVGCKVADALVPGAAKYCMRLKTCDDARRLRNAIGECLEFASRPDVIDNNDNNHDLDVLLPDYDDSTSNAAAAALKEAERQARTVERQRRATFCIIGGGPTGVELAGELGDFVRDITKPRVGSYANLRHDIRIVLIQGGSELVPQFDANLRKHALETLRKANVNVRLNTLVKEVRDGSITIIPKQSADDPTTEEVIYTGVTVWAAGTGPVPFVEKLLEKLPPEARGTAGRIAVDQWLRCPTPSHETFGSILVLGDAASFADTNINDNDDDEYNNVVTESFLPQTAQVAGQQGAYAAHLLCRGYNLTVSPPTIVQDGSLLSQWIKLRGLEQAQGFEFVNLGLLAYVGGGEAVTQIQIGDFPVGSYAGSISYVLWRSVYLVKQVATRNRVLVTFDWIKSAVFGRDITRL